MLLGSYFFQKSVPASGGKVGLLFVRPSSLLTSLSPYNTLVTDLTSYILHSPASDHGQTCMQRARAHGQHAASARARSQHSMPTRGDCVPA